MTMTIVVTRNAPGRYRGFLASCMPEISPGIYASPRLKKPVRQRIWQVMIEWAEALPEDGGVVMLWEERSAPSGLGMHVLGYPRTELIDHEGLWLSHRNLPSAVAHDLLGHGDEEE